MKCPICRSVISQKRSRTKYRYFLTCQNCGGYFAKRKPNAVYSENYFAEKGATVISNLFSPLLNLFYLSRVNRVRLHIPKNGSRVLDYGCGSGKLVAQLNNSGIKTIGFEPSSGARKIAKKQGIPVYDKLMRGTKYFDLVMFWHSLEHTDSPADVIAKIKPILKVGGKLLIAVPNIDSLEAKFTREKWFHFSYPFHLVHFTPRAIKIMLDQNGFEIESIDFFNPEYTISGLVQSLLNLVLPKDVLYSVVAHRRLNFDLPAAIILSLLSILIAIIFSPLLFIVFIIQLTLKKTGAMVVVAWKRS